VVMSVFRVHIRLESCWMHSRLDWTGKYHVNARSVAQTQQNRFRCRRCDFVKMLCCKDLECSGAGFGPGTIAAYLGGLSNDCCFEMCQSADRDRGFCLRRAAVYGQGAGVSGG